MLTVLPWLAVVLALLGNCGIWLFVFNRVNAFGYPRAFAKLAEKFCIVSCFAIPTLLFSWNRPAIVEWVSGNRFWPENGDLFFQGWLAGSLTSFVVLSPFWLESRLWMKPPRNLVRSEGKLHNVHREIAGGSARNLKTRLWARVPFNEWGHLEVTRKLLKLPRGIPGAEALTIGHISDLHFTGQYTPDHYRYVIQKLMEHRPMMIVISGDIIDFQHCMSYVDAVLNPLSAPLGCFFVLGNHERRLKHVPTLIDRLTQLGFVDLGTKDRTVVAGDVRIWLTGNELPWFNRRLHQPKRQAVKSAMESNDILSTLPNAVGNRESASDLAMNSDYLRLGVAHTPDCIRWARRANIDLLLAGHTHGGQARFPLIGPLVAPSIYGSKFASGVFHLPPTLMHVSRGVAGTHTIRWRCPPEVSILQLTNKSQVDL